MKVTRGGTVSKLLTDVQIPDMFRARQTFPRESIAPEQIPAVVEQQIAQPCFSEKIKPGMSIAITAGSRGIRNVDIITRAVVDAVKRRGAEPFIVPAMGSHGGATAEGQKEMLAGFGITEEAMGCPIKSSMEVVELGYSSLGKRVVLEKAPILFAIPCIENAYDETAMIEAILPENILERETELLEVAKANMPSLIVGEGDVLVVDEIGKNYSGTGVDPNITGTFSTDFAHGGIQVQRTAFLNLSEISHGNALGVGLASAITSSPHAVARGTPTRAARGHAAGAQRWFADHGIGAPARV